MYHSSRPFADRNDNIWPQPGWPIIIFGFFILLWGYVIFVSCIILFRSSVHVMQGLCFILGFRLLSVFRVFSVRKISLFRLLFLILCVPFFCFSSGRMFVCCVGFLLPFSFLIALGAF